MKFKTALLTGVSLLAIGATSQTAFADSSRMKPSYEELEKRIEDLERRMDEQGGDPELKGRVSTLEQRMDDVNWSFDNLRPTVKTGDGRFSMSIRARMQTDFATYFQDDNLPAAVVDRDLNAGTYIRRAYFGVEGLAFKDFWYEFRANFGGGPSESASINLARIAYFGIPDFRINIGVIQPIFTYGDTVSSGGMYFLERPEIVNIAAGTFGGSDSRIGAEFTYQKAGFIKGDDNFFITGAFTGKSTASTGTKDERSSVLGRIGYRLWSDGTSNFQIGGSAARLLDAGNPPDTITLADRPQVRADGTNLVTTGAIPAESGNMWGVDTAMNFGSLYVAAEYHQYDLERTTAGLSDPSFDGWYVEGEWLLTGEAKPYSASSRGNEIGSFGNPKVVKPFSLDGHSWGSWGLVARYSELDLDYRPNDPVVAERIRGGEQDIATLGINWYMNNNIKMILQGSHVEVDRMNGAGAQIGQDLEILGARLQLSN